MIIAQDMNLEDFEFWAGAKDNAQKCTLGQLRDIQYALEQYYPEGLDATALNDLFCFDFEKLKEFTTGIED